MDLSAYQPATPWDRINEDILKVVSLEMISKHDFTYFFQLSLLDSPSELLNRFFGLSLSQANILLAGSYKIKGGKYVLRSSSDTPQLRSLMRFLQGMVQFRQVFSESDLRPELSELSSYIQDAIQYPLQVKESIEGRFDGLLLCIICMLQDARFIFDGQEVGRLFLSREERSELNFLQLCCEFDALKRKVRFPVILTNLNADVYLAFDGSKYRFFEPLPLMNAVRDGNGRLMLKEARI